MRLVDPEGQQLGIKPLPEALTIARQLDLDLVEVAPHANHPVCRIMDYGKFKFDAAQRAKESRRRTTSVGVKEMKYRPKIGPGDFDTKTRKVRKFLGEGHKVKVTIMFRGREVFHPELGKKILDMVAKEVDGTARVETEARLDGRNMVMVLAPDKRAKQSAEARAHRDGDEWDGDEAEGHESAAAAGSSNGAPAAAAPQTPAPRASAPRTPAPAVAEPQTPAPASAEPQTPAPASAASLDGQAAASGDGGGGS